MFQGSFASHINEFFYDRKLYLFDTFEGFPDKYMNLDKERGYTYKGRNPELYKDTSVDVVLSKMKYKENVLIRKGFFPDTLQGLEEEFCFVSLDMDLYVPLKAGLEYFYPRLLRGGYIFIHDCNIGHDDYKGARIALLEFIEKENIGYVMLPDNCTAVITK
nr:TylF/MycF/NovP-related O-methyltransferase [uncultured Schaedlerella sp.]